MTPMPEDRLAEIEQRLTAATPGPWQPDGPFWWRGGDVAPDCATVITAGEARDAVCVMPSEQDRTGYVRADAELIANAPADLAWAVAEIKRLRESFDSAIGVVTVTPIPDQSPIVNGATSMWGYSTPYATVQDAQQRAMSTATVCLLVPVDADGNLL